MQPVQWSANKHREQDFPLRPTRTISRVFPGRESIHSKSWYKDAPVVQFETFKKILFYKWKRWKCSFLCTWANVGWPNVTIWGFCFDWLFWKTERCRTNRVKVRTRGLEIPTLMKIKVSIEIQVTKVVKPYHIQCYKLRDWICILSTPRTLYLSVCKRCRAPWIVENKFLKISSKRSHN